MSFSLSTRSERNLCGVHADLVAVVRRAIQITAIDFTVLEGLRSKERQTELVKQGASKTLNSRHLTGHAVDLAPYVFGRVSWHWPHYDQLAMYIKKAAEDVDVSVVWGGDWVHFRDGPHWELPRHEYPAKAGE